MTNKQFSIVGVSTHKGKTKLRFANDPMRIKVLLKNGHDVGPMIDLPNPMTKGEIASYLIETNFAGDNAAYADAVAYTATKNTVSPRQYKETASYKTVDMVTA